MKTISLRFMALMCLGLAVSACDESEITTVLYSSDMADFTVTNQTTGETVENETLQTGGLKALEVQPGDVLRLSYTPPEEYKQYNWEVEFIAFNDTVTVSSPYVANYTIAHTEPGEYRVACRGTVVAQQDEETTWVGEDTGSVHIKVVE